MYKNSTLEKSQKVRVVRWFFAHAETIALSLLFLWCMLPAYISAYDLIMGTIGAFPKGDDIKFGSIAYAVAIDMYYKAFCILGWATLLFSVLCAALCWPRIIEWGRFKRQPWFYLFGLFLMWTMLSTILSDDPVYAIIGSFYRHDGLLSYFFYSGIFLCASMVVEEKHRRLLLRAYCAMLVWLCILMLGQQSGGQFLQYCFPSARAVVFNQQNHFGYVLCMGIVASMGLFLFNEQTGRVNQFLYLAAHCLFTITLLYNRTFGAYLGALIGIIAVYVFYFRSGRKAGWQVFLPIVLFVALSIMNVTGVLSPEYSVSNDFQALTSDVQDIVEGAPEADHAGTGRGILWKQTLQRIGERPLFGFGPEGFYGEHALTSNLPPHNEYLQIAGFLGMPALFLYLAALLTLAIKQWKNLKVLKPLVLAAAGTAVAYLASAFVGNPLFNTSPFLWIFLGLATLGTEAPLLSLPESGAEERLLARTEKKNLVKKLIPLMIVLALVLGGIFIYLNDRAEQSSEMGDLQCIRLAESVAALQYADTTPESDEAYWFDAMTFSLIPAEDPMPTPYGMGTKLQGHTVAGFNKEYGTQYEYDESVDYTNQLLKVTVSPGKDAPRIKTEWVEYEP